MKPVIKNKDSYSNPVLGSDDGVPTVVSLYQFIKLDGGLFFVLMFGALTYYFYLKGTGKFSKY